MISPRRVRLVLIDADSAADLCVRWSTCSTHHRSCTEHTPFWAILLESPKLNLVNKANIDVWVDGSFDKMSKDARHFCLESKVLLDCSNFYECSGIWSKSKEFMGFPRNIKKFKGFQQNLADFEEFWRILKDFEEFWKILMNFKKFKRFCSILQAPPPLPLS